MQMRKCTYWLRMIVCSANLTMLRASGATLGKEAPMSHFQGDLQA